MAPEAISPTALPQMIAARDVVPAMRQVLKEFQAVHEVVARQVDLATACFSNVIQPLINAGNRMQGQIAVIAMLRYASPDKAAREASEEALRLMSEVEAETTSRRDLYLLIKAVKHKEEDLDTESQKYLDELLKDYTRCGHGTLEGDGIAEYLESRNAIDVMRRQFTRNIMDDEGGVWFTEAELDGISNADLGRFRPGPGSDTKQYFVHFRKAEAQPVLKYAKNPATRKRLYTSQYKTLEENVKLFRDVIVRRDSNARRLGYTSHAAFRLEKRMAKSPEWVHDFLDKLQDVLLPQGRKDMDGLLARKKEYLQGSEYRDENADIMPPWDLQFYTRLIEEESNIDHEMVSQYFPLQNTVASMLGIFAHCLQLRFEKLAPEKVIESTWHQDVDAWSVWDERPDVEGDFVGYLYMDLLFRPNKYRGSQDVNLQCSYVKGDGTRVYPATLLMCAFPRPTSISCALLKHRDVVSVFHELGHGIHDLLSRTKYSRFHGWQSPPDFAETPSVMLENWCWMKEELRQMSCHYTTLDPGYLEGWLEKHPGEPTPPQTIPDDLLDSLVAGRNRHRVLQLLDILAVSRFDMAVHDPPSHEDCLSLNPTTLFNQAEEKLRILLVSDQNDRGHPHAHFGHLLSGYDAGYYAYLSAQVLAAEIFESNFAENPRSQPAWERYRRGILQYGASRDELDMVQEFLGRPPSPGALLRSLHLQKVGVPR